MTAPGGSEQELVELRGSGSSGQGLWVINDLTFIRGWNWAGMEELGVAAGPAGKL